MKDCDLCRKPTKEGYVFPTDKRIFYGHKICMKLLQENKGDFKKAKKARGKK